MADVMEIEEFLELTRNGASERVAAVGVGWTPKKLRELKQDPDFVDLMDDATEYFLDDVETAIKRKAKEGVRWAAEMVLFNRRPEFWRPPAQKISIDSKTTVTHEVVMATVGAARELLLEPGAIAALQQNSIEASVRDED